MGLSLGPILANNIMMELERIIIDKNKTDLYYKPTPTGQYSDISSNVPWNYKSCID